MKLRKFGSWIANLFYPNHIKCIFCGEELDENSTFDTCKLCLQTLPFITNPCTRCGDQLNESYSSVCELCKNKNHNFTQAKSVFEYSGSVLNLVHRFKYNRKTYLTEPITKFMCEIFATWGIEPDVICDVPMHKSKLKKRKKNHSTTLALGISNITNIPYLPLCEKNIDNPSQTTLSFGERHKNVENVYALNKEFLKEIKNKTILIIDDVITTGSTIDELSKVLLSHEAKAVFALSFAHTSLKEK